jgi:1-acyl-sn-glycerol-3-phosphate acyltransferase
MWVLYVINSLYCRLGFHWRANRKCPFAEARPGIVIANHRSPVDPLLAWAGMWNCRPVECMTAAEYFSVPGLSMFFRWLHAIPVARDGKDMVATRTALRRLEEGRLVGVFPEGRINRGEGLLPGNPGIAFLALRSRAPVFPMYIHNSPQSEGMVEPFWSFCRVKITFGDPVDLSAYYDRPRTNDLMQEVTDLLMRRIGELGGLYPPAPEPADLEKPDTLPMVAPSASA